MYSNKGKVWSENNDGMKSNFLQVKLEPGEKTELTFLKEIAPTESDRACIEFMFRKISSNEGV